MSAQRRNVSATLVFDMPLTKGQSVLCALVLEDQIELNDMAGQVRSPSSSVFYLRQTQSTMFDS
jgi:hypothetical protein